MELPILSSHVTSLQDHGVSSTSFTFKAINGQTGENLCIVDHESRVIWILPHNERIWSIDIFVDAAWIDSEASLLAYKSTD